ncbi:hypothetical protein SALBM217S_05716 [Streptomyces griseoloalbus]
MRTTVPAPGYAADGRTRYGLGLAWRPARGLRSGIWYHGGTSFGTASETAVAPDGRVLAAAAVFTTRFGDEEAASSSRRRPRSACWTGRCAATRRAAQGLRGAHPQRTPLDFLVGVAQSGAWAVAVTQLDAQFASHVGLLGSVTRCVSIGDHGRVIRRHELSDAEWAFVQTAAARSERGRRRLDELRTVLNGIVWKFRTGTAWRDVPERYGSWATLHTRFRRWAKDGTFERMLRAAQARADAAGDIEWLVSVDSTIVRARQHAAGARKGGSAPGLGRSRGGLTSEIHLACDGAGRPLRLHRHRREHQRLHAVHRRDGGDSGAPARVRDGPGSGPTTSSATRATSPRPYAPGCGDGTSGTPFRNSTTRFATGSGAAVSWRQHAGLRPRDLQAAQRGRTVLQPPQAVAWHRHPLRQDRRVLPSSRHPRIAADVGVTFGRTPRLPDDAAVAVKTAHVPVVIDRLRETQAVEPENDLLTTISCCTHPPP